MSAQQQAQAADQQQYRDAPGTSIKQPVGGAVCKDDGNEHEHAAGKARTVMQGKKRR